MQTHRRLLKITGGTLLSLIVVLLSTGCQCCKQSQTTASQPTPAPALVTREVPKPALPTVRIRAGTSESFTDSDGNLWLPDQGFTGGDTIARADDLKIENTKDPAIYRTERYSMTDFSRELPNGKYIVKLHFAETFEGISGAGQRVFSFNVEGHEFKDFDLWVKAGGPQRAFVESIPVEIRDGKLDIRFISNIENPEINGIEILPAL